MANRASTTPYFSSNNNGNRQVLKFPTNFETGDEGKFSVVRSVLQLGQSFVAPHADTRRCTSVVLFLESDVAVVHVGLMTVRTAQIWGRKIASEIISLNARSQDFGGLWCWNHPLILNS